MRRFIFFVILSFCSTMLLNAQIWEMPEAGTLEIRKSDEINNRMLAGQFIMHDFPANPQDGDYINLPGPDGQLIAVSLKSSPVLEPALQSRFPQIQSFTFHAEEISGRLALDPSGIDVVFTTSDKRYALEQVGDHFYELYRLSVPRQSGTDPATELGVCLTPMGPDVASVYENPLLIRRAPIVNQRIYDLAISVTSTYAAKHGGSTESVLAEVNKIFNRVNEVFLRELALRFQIIDESTKLFFLNTETDPYTEGNNTLMLNKLDEVLVKTIGRKNYDLGHLLATNCGSGTAGVSAGIGTICEFNKGKALSCDLTNNLEDYVRVLTHELGHQLGAAHSWSNCPGINNTQRSGSTAYEPGSGSSIMSYIGTCGNQNLRYIPGPFYFHTGSLQEMLEYVDIGPGSTCVSTEEISNESPEIVSINIPEKHELVEIPYLLLLS